MEWIIVLLTIAKPAIVLTTPNPKSSSFFIHIVYFVFLLINNPSGSLFIFISSPLFLKAIRHWTRYGKHTALSGRYHSYCLFLGLPCVPPPSSFSFYNFNFILDTSYQTMRIWVCITNSFLQFSISSLASQPLPPSSSSSPLFSVRLLLFFLFLIATKFTEVLRVSNEPPDSPSDFWSFVRGTKKMYVFSTK